MVGFMLKYPVLALFLMIGDSVDASSELTSNRAESVWFSGTYALAPSACESHALTISRHKIIDPTKQLFSELFDVYAVSNDNLINDDGTTSLAVTLLTRLADGQFLSLSLAAINEAMADAVDMPYTNGTLLYFFFVTDDLPSESEITRRMQSHDVEDYGVLFRCTSSDRLS